MSDCVAMGNTKFAITVAILTCRRFNLLKKTIESVKGISSTERLLLDCDNDTNTLQYAEARGYSAVPAAPMSNRERNIMCNIDALYRRVKTRFVYFTEDDWQLKHRWFVRRAVRLLIKSQSTISVVAATGSGNGGWGWYTERCPLIRDGGFGAWTNQAHLADPTFIRNHTQGAKFCSVAHEAEVTRKWFYVNQSCTHKIAYFNSGASVVHLGGGASVRAHT